MNKWCNEIENCHQPDKRRKSSKIFSLVRRLMLSLSFVPIQEHFLAACFPSRSLWTSSFNCEMYSLLWHIYLSSLTQLALHDHSAYPLQPVPSHYIVHWRRSQASGACFSLTQCVSFWCLLLSYCTIERLAFLFFRRISVFIYWWYVVRMYRIIALHFFL